MGYFKQQCGFFLHKRINTSPLKMINRLSGTIILLFGIVALTIFL